jgi:hypothetical protein
MDKESQGRYNEHKEVLSQGHSEYKERPPRRARHYVPGRGTKNIGWNKDQSRKDGSQDWREFQTQLKEVEAGAQSGRGTGTGAGAAVQLKFDGTTTWAVFWLQFETVAKHNCWTCQDKYTYLISTLQGRVTEVLQGVPKGATYEETLEALEDRFGDQHLASTYCSQLKTRTPGVGKPFQESVTAV